MSLREILYVGFVVAWMHQSLVFLMAWLLVVTFHYDLGILEATLLGGLLGWVARWFDDRLGLRDWMDQW